MAIKLEKGGRFNLTKKEPSLEKVMIGLGWELKPSVQLDLDASVFMLGKNGKLISDEYFVFYNNLKSPDGGVQHTGDNRDGEGDGDDEFILLNMSTINQEVEEILIVVSIHDAFKRNHNFGLLDEAYIRVADVKTKREVLRYDLGTEYPSDTEVTFGKLKKVENEWIFEASGIGTKKGLEAIVNVYA
jgi:tellurium resistance protein TerD